MYLALVLGSCTEHLIRRLSAQLTHQLQQQQRRKEKILLYTHHSWKQELWFVWSRKGQSERQHGGEWVKEPQVLHLPAGAKSWRKDGEMGQLTENLVGHTDRLGIYPEGKREPLKDLSRSVTRSDLHFGKNSLVENN